MGWIDSGVDERHPPLAQPIFSAAHELPVLADLIPSLFWVIAHLDGQLLNLSHAGRSGVVLRGQLR
jgi:hypothetical protein